jgi:branched-chain amino acid transport system substrate-binding protein
VGWNSGIGGANVGGIPKGVNAWVASINASGGLNCHPLRYLIADDGADPSRNQELIQQMITQNHVLAFVGMNDVLTAQASIGYVDQQRIPVIGDSTGETAQVFQSPMYFPQSPSGPAMFELTVAALSQIGKPLGKVKLAAVTCIEAALCSSAGPSIPQWAARFGMQMVYQAKASIVQPDYTALCQGAQNAGAQTFAVIMDSGSIGRLIKSCSTVNYHPIFAAPSLTAALSLAGDQTNAGLIGGLGVIPWMVTSNPGVTQYLQALHQYAPGLQPDAQTISGWVAAKIFQEATQHLSEPPTSQSVLQGLWSIKNNDFGGMTAPLTFVANQPPVQQVCWFIVQISGGKWVPLNGAGRSCA